MNEVQSVTSGSYCCVVEIETRYMIMKNSFHQTDRTSPPHLFIHVVEELRFFFSCSMLSSSSLFTYGTAHLIVCYHSENKPLDSTTAIEMVEEELLNQDGHHGKKEQPSTSPILSSSNKSITTTLPSIIPVPSSSQRKRLPQGFGYISGSFEVEKLSSSVANNVIIGEFGEKDESQVTEVELHLLILPSH